MTKLIYLENAYKKEHHAKVTAFRSKGNHFELELTETIFYPQGGGQASDKGLINGKNGTFTVNHVRMHEGKVIHEGKLKGKLKTDETVSMEIDWEWRYQNMRLHSAGHILHDVIMEIVPGITPIRANHTIKNPYIEYRGIINPKLKETLEKRTNMAVAEELIISTKFVTFIQLQKIVEFVPENLPKNKPLRIIQIGSHPPVPDGGTQVYKTTEIGHLKIQQIEVSGSLVRVYYQIEQNPLLKSQSQNPDVISKSTVPQININNFRSLLIEIESELLNLIPKTNLNQLENLRVEYFGSHGKAAQIIRKIKDLPQNERKNAGILVNEFKKTIDREFNKIYKKLADDTNKNEWFDTSIPGEKPPQGHLHIVTTAISEITSIFNRLGFTRHRYPEIDWDWYAFESLNMPPSHPARDEWETFHIANQNSKFKNHKFQKMVLTPHTSNSQVREMEKGKMPIRMINIAKCYRRQIDASHTPMFHQFEGLYIDKNVSIGDLKGVFDFFVKNFYGQERITRLRPFHFQFTEPSFEVDIICGICLGKSILPDGSVCKLCKQGWLELGGAGMVHPNVLKAGGLDPDIYNGFAFGWGVERTYMMKAGTMLNDNRLLYYNDIRFLEQF